MNVRKIQELRELSKEKRPFYGKNVLLAEDHRMNREIFSELLGWYGFSVEQAENGKVAVEKVEKVPEGTYDIILMDLGMPVLDGYRAAVQIRNIEKNRSKKLPIVGISGYVMEEEIQKAMNCGMNAYLFKPFEEDEMLQVFQMVLGMEKSRC